MIEVHALPDEAALGMVLDKRIPDTASVVFMDGEQAVSFAAEITAAVASGTPLIALCVDGERT